MAERNKHQMQEALVKQKLGVSRINKRAPSVEITLPRVHSLIIQSNQNDWQPTFK